jgi:hypothetical protein
MVLALLHCSCDRRDRLCSAKKVTVVYDWSDQYTVLVNLEEGMVSIGYRS